MKLFIMITLMSSFAVAQSVCVEKENFFKVIMNDLMYNACMVNREQTELNKKMCKVYSDNIELQARRQAK